MFMAHYQGLGVEINTLLDCVPDDLMGSGIVHYTLKGENHVIAVDGCEGKVLGGGRPLFKIT